MQHQLFLVVRDVGLDVDMQATRWEAACLSSRVDPTTMGQEASGVGQCSIWTGALPNFGAPTAPETPGVQAACVAASGISPALILSADHTPPAISGRAGPVTVADQTNISRGAFSISTHFTQAHTTSYLDHLITCFTRKHSRVAYSPRLRLPIKLSQRLIQHHGSHQGGKASSSTVHLTCAPNHPSMTPPSTWSRDRPLFFPC
jgi:hypothetical protein